MLKSTHIPEDGGCDTTAATSGPHETINTGYVKKRALRHYDAAKRRPLFTLILEPLASRFGMTIQEVRTHFLRYNLSINEETNETYRLLGTQFALFINYLPRGTWFAKRLDHYAHFTGHLNDVLDVGFGIPFSWMIACDTGERRTGHFTLVDSSQSALDFAHEFILLAKRRFPRTVDALRHSLILGQLEESSTWPVHSPQAVVALDCIEHAVKPRRCLVALGERFSGAKFLIGLPVGTPIPQHAIDFDTTRDAIAFIRNARFTIEKTVLVSAAWEKDVVGNPAFEGSLFIYAS